MKGYYGKHERNNLKTFQLNNILCITETQSVKSYTQQSFT